MFWAQRYMAIEVVNICLAWGPKTGKTCNYWAPRTSEIHQSFQAIWQLVWVCVDAIYNGHNVFCCWYNYIWSLSNSSDRLSWWISNSLFLESCPVHDPATWRVRLIWGRNVSCWPPCIISWVDFDWDWLVIFSWMRCELYRHLLHFVRFWAQRKRFCILWTEQK